MDYVTIECGKCADHYSANKFGYPAAYVAETNEHVDDGQLYDVDEDPIDYNRMYQHALLALAFAYELAATKAPGHDY